MPAKLTTTIAKIASVPNKENAALIHEFQKYLKDRNLSENHQNNCLKVAIAFGKFLGPHMSFYDVSKRDQITAFLDTKMKSPEEDPENIWITTWNHYLRRIKLFIRWLHNGRGKEYDHDDSYSDWQTPMFARTKEKRTKRLSPYTETEIWEKDELLFIVKYEPQKRNKAALTLFWDLDARNHEVTLLRIKHIRLKERYGEGEIPYEAKTGSGPILLTCSFPYVRDWLNEHPFKNNPEARLICNLYNGSPVRPEQMWAMFKQLRKRIVRMLENGTITDRHEREKLEYLLKTKKWNPYCLRHSAITADSDFLPDFALKKKVRWSMNSKQGSRYIKRKMGNELKREILARNGIVSDEEAMRQKPSVLNCPKCSFVNAVENKYCSRCSYALTPDAFEELKAQEKMNEQELESMNKRINSLESILFAIQPKLRNVKPEVLGEMRLVNSYGS